MTDSVFVAWQDNSTRSWHTVAKLTRVETGYELAFTEGIKPLKNIPSKLFSMSLPGRYRSTKLIPLFKSRLPTSTRNDLNKIQKWLDLDGSEDEFVQLGKFGLIPGSDSLMVYPAPRIVGNSYQLDFFIHGVRHMTEEAKIRCEHLSSGDILLPMFDVQNNFDPNAIALRTLDQHLIGYVPTFYADDFRRIFASEGGCARSKIFVKKCNLDAPAQLRALCSINGFVDSDFKPLNTISHQTFSMGSLTISNSSE